MVAAIAQIIQQIVEKLESEYKPLKVILFGSFSADKSGSDSDIDLLIIKDTNERFIDRWVTVRKILSDPKRKLAIETLILTPKEINERLSGGDQFISEIIENGKELYVS
ncbi:MAG: hypothetical protein A2V93_05880 [Ignavibacteria bacterium RBG_16_34_14]|nr:MAG: hypothetical protein A2V93_05880 [Ignavibacteria bacterium RBG_16_34_14]